MLENHANEGKGLEKRKERGGKKEEKRKTAMVALLVSLMPHVRVLFDGNVFKKSAR